MNVLVIGGTRYIGKHLIAELIRQGHTVTIATRGIAADHFGSSVKRLVIDRTNRQSLQQVFADRSYDIVFDTLAYSSDDVRNLLDHLHCGKYVMVSTTTVYQKHINTTEEDFDPLKGELIWCDRTRFPYGELKRQAEYALFQQYGHINFTAVRFPFIIGCDDYTKRLYFYVEHIVRQKAMHVDNFDQQMSFVRSDEAGKFLAFFANHDFCGAINGANRGTVSIREIADYIERKTGKRAILSPEGDNAPYNGEREYSINTDKATQLGFSFSPIQPWIYDLIDQYIQDAEAYF